MADNPWSFDNPFFEGLESDPEGQRANYFSFQDKFGKGNRRTYFENQFRAITDRFAGHIGSLAASGQQPAEDDTLRAFYEKYFATGGGADTDFYGMSPATRGQGTAQFAPPTRWIM